MKKRTLLWVALVLCAGLFVTACESNGESAWSTSEYIKENPTSETASSDSIESGDSQNTQNSENSDITETPDGETTGSGWTKYY